MRRFKEHRATFIVAAVTAAVTAGTPVVARTVADFARNADKVDGRHAVGAGASIEKRVGKLVATNGSGHLPNDIIRKAPEANNADRLGGLGAGTFARSCGAGTLRGHAHVPRDVASDFTDVPGFSTTYGGPIEPDGTICHIGPARARRFSTGIYDVRLASIAWSCDSDLPPGIVTAVVTVESASPLAATYEPVCDAIGVLVRVHITDLAGVPQDAAFSVALLDESGYPIP